jgi:hypothetical protein
MMNKIMLSGMNCNFISKTPSLLMLEGERGGQQQERNSNNNKNKWSMCALAGNRASSKQDDRPGLVNVPKKREATN